MTTAFRVVGSTEYEEAFSQQATVEVEALAHEPPQQVLAEESANEVDEPASAESRRWCLLLFQMLLA